tara:strand:+ start:762 stop:2150 length:1389 start_codon:yes stop_codon:yes gene_type:complete
MTTNNADFKVKKGLVVADGDVTVPSDHSVKAGTFDTNVAAAGVTLTAVTLSADGTDTNIPINITPKGNSSVVISRADINAGTIDATSVGSTTASTGDFTTLTADTSLVVTGTADNSITGASLTSNGITKTVASHVGEQALMVQTKSGSSSATITKAGNISSGAATFTISDGSNTSALKVGMRINGTSIPTAARIASIDSSTQITMNLNATATVNGGNVSFTPEVLQVQYHTGSTYNDALTVSAQSGRVGILKEPHTSDALNIGGSTRMTGSLNSVINVNASGYLHGASGKLRNSDGFPTGTADGTQHILEVDGTNFYTSKTMEVAIATDVNPGDKITIMGINTSDSNDDTFQAVEVFGMMSIINSSDVIKYRYVQKLYGVYNRNGTFIDEVTTMDFGDKGFGSGTFFIDKDTKADGTLSGNHGMIIGFKQNTFTSSLGGRASGDVIHLSVNVNGLASSGIGA